jgi:hypothetical protein
MNTTKRVTCPKCDGSGKLRHFMHIDNGRCFECAGVGKVEIDPRPLPPGRPSDPARVRQNFINIFGGALRMLREEGATWLNEPEDSFTNRTERERIAAHLNAPECPPDVRVRALSAFAAVGVSF